MFPDFNEKYLEIGEEVQVLIITMTNGSRETAETASAFIAEQGYSFPVFYDTDHDAAATYGVYSLPTTYFIDERKVLHLPSLRQFGRRDP